MIVVMPMAGRGSRFAGSGYAQPKPLIPVLGKPMFIHALRSIEGIHFSKLIIVALEEHERDYHISGSIAHLGQHVELVLLPDVTDGQLCTVLAASAHLRKNEDLLIVSSDTIVVSGIGTDIQTMPENCKGLISVANMPGDRWSFARTDVSGKVVEVAEKVRISDHASTGLYYFSNASEFISIGEAMVRNQEKTKGEYYVIPVYQKLIDAGHFVGISIAREMWDLGTPDSLHEFLRQHPEKTN